MDFDTRYKKLNTAQKQAVDTIDGPVMVIAGPGTGKTELLSMRAANILRQTDTLPGNILCLTFTESGVAAMRARLASIIGPDAYRVAIHTFHSFGSEIISSHREYFYHGAVMKPADDLTQLEILTHIFDSLSYDNLLSSKLNGNYVHLEDTLRSISDLKRSGLTSDEFLKILDAGDSVMDSCEAELADIFAHRIAKSTIEALIPLSEKIASLPQPKMPAGMTPLASTLALSLAHAIDEAQSLGKTTPITTWKNTWLEKDNVGRFVFKSRKRHAKLRSLAFIYYRYLSVMNERSRYDYDDMILEVIHAFETQPDLRYNLQEKYQYIMVDEFQDTNLAQLRLLLDIGDNPVHEGRPNILVVGDDDQAIYSFQGAEVGNILQFKGRFPSLDQIILTENYRSAPVIIERASDVIALSSERLSHFDDRLQKNLQPNVPATASRVAVYESETVADEYTHTVTSIAALLEKHVSPHEIAVIARTHRELEAILMYFNHKNIAINYERRDNVLDIESVKLLELLARVALLLYENRLSEVDALLPELLAHPAFGFEAADLWQLSLAAYSQRRLWIDTMATFPVFAPFHTWLIKTSQQIPHLSLEAVLDILMGSVDDEAEYISPYKTYFFSEERRATTPSDYLTFLGALKTLRAKLRDFSSEQPHLQTFIEFVDMHREYNRTIMNTSDAAQDTSGAVQLMTAHRSKGLEFKHVFVIGATDKNWGMMARGRATSITYPENLPLAASTGSVNERLRLFFVAMTRAKQTLSISYAIQDHVGKPLLPAGFLMNSQFDKHTVDSPQTIADMVQSAEFDWRGASINLPGATMKQLLTPQLESYRLSATHINNFIDVSNGGPDYFLIQNLLHFPSARSSHAGYGTAIHTALQQAHVHLLSTGHQKPLEDVLRDFETALKDQQLSAEEYARFIDQGIAGLTRFLDSSYGTFSLTAKPEFNFGPQHVVYNNARLTGKLDVVEIDQTNKTLSVTDYKTGKPARDWKGRADYEKVKLHKYKQQLMFYRLLAEHSRDFHDYTFEGGALQFIEPASSGEIMAPLRAEFTEEDYRYFKQLVLAVWQRIMALDLPDTSSYSPDYAGILQFEADLIDNNI